jgi:hypothetical protein
MCVTVERHGAAAHGDQTQEGEHHRALPCRGPPHHADPVVLESNGYGVRELRSWCQRVTVMMLESDGYGF